MLRCLRSLEAIGARDTMDDHKVRQIEGEHDDFENNIYSLFRSWLTSANVYIITIYIYLFVHY